MFSMFRFLMETNPLKVMSEFLHREGGRYWTTIDGVRQLYRRIECKMCFEVIEKLKGL